MDCGTLLSPLEWRKRVGVEPTDDWVTSRPPVLKTGTITGPCALPKKISGRELRLIADQQNPLVICFA